MSSRYGEAGSGAKITIAELRDLIEREEIKPSKIFEKEDFLKDSKLMKRFEEIAELEAYRAEKKTGETEEDKKKMIENEMIPGDDKPILTPEEREQQKKDNEFVPDDNEPGGDDDLIPD